MTSPTPRVVASLLHLAGGLVVAVLALAIVLAKVLVDAGAAVNPADAALLADLLGVLPLVIAFAAITLTAAAGLALGSSWAPNVAFGSALVAVTIGAFGLFLLIVGRDPFAPGAVSAPMTGGLAIVASFTVVYLLVIVALAAARSPRTITSGAAA